MKDPLKVLARRFPTGSGDVAAERSVWIGQADRRENPRALRAIVVQEGPGDDSIAGVWASLDLVLAVDGGWRVARDERATRCSRGKDVTTWSGRPCP